MKTQAIKTNHKNNHSDTNEFSSKHSGGASSFQFVDNRPGTISQRKLLVMANDSEQLKHATQLKAITGSPVIQKKIEQEDVDEIYNGEKAKFSLDDMQEHTETSMTTIEKEIGGTGAEKSDLAGKLKEKAVHVETDVWDGFEVDDKEKLFFENYYSNSVWIMANNFNNRRLSTFDASALVNWQAKLAGIEGEPGFIVRKNVVNKSTKDEANKLKMDLTEGNVRIEAEGFSKLINETDNGRHTARILNEHGLKPVSVQIYGTEKTPTIVIKAEPGEWILPDRPDKQLQEMIPEMQLEQEDTDNAPPASKCCFLTTACTEFRGLPDDCSELTVLRRFRDEYMKKLPDGEEMINTYYRIAPKIVENMKSDPAKETILNEIYHTITACIACINSDKPNEALLKYKTMVLDLSQKYLG
jgi:hypothetical protein